MSLTIPIILINVLASIAAFNRPELMARYQFNPYMVHHRRQWYRFITHAFLHADWLHLIVNMLVLYIFGTNVEIMLHFYFPNYAGLIYLGLYFGAIIAASVSTYLKHRNNHWYNAVGASGAVGAVLFSFVAFSPFQTIYLYAIFPLPAILWAVLYLVYSVYMSRRGGDNINHDAHLWGSLFGFVYTIIMDPEIARGFIDQITGFLR